MPDTAFFERSNRVAEQFLQTAVVVDDEPYYAELKPTKVKAPGRGTVSTKSTSADTTLSASRNRLDAKGLVDSFADKGIVCGIIQPNLIDKNQPSGADTITQVKARTDEATSRADIVILDWNLRNEDPPEGTDAKNIIKDILKSDLTNSPGHASVSRRLRLIAVYTGETGLTSIAAKLHELSEELGLDNPKIDGCRVEAGPVTFVVYGKEGSTIQEEDPSRRVSPSDLPARLLNDFTAQTPGLLSNVALASLSAVRANTHRVLTRFGAHVDAPYVAHRAMMVPPEEAADHPVPLVAAEIESVLADASEIREHVSTGALRDWLNSLTDVPLGTGLEMEPDTFKSQLLELLDSGVKDSDVTGAPPKWAELVESLRTYGSRDKASVLSDQLTSSGVSGSDADAAFALLTSTRSQYEAPKPFLRLGTVVAYKRSGKWRYRLCIQPLCDSVRLSTTRAFPFLRLGLVTSSGDEPFDLVVNQGGTLRRLHVSLKVHEMEMIDMKPDLDSQSVLADSTNHGRIFTTDQDAPTQLLWIADLKTEFAHRISNAFAAELSRVGLTESEWLRRMAKAYPKQVQETTDGGFTAGG